MWKIRQQTNFKGDLADLNMVSGEGLPVNCHAVMVVALSPFLKILLADSKADQVILPDFSIAELSGLLNLLYTGMYVHEN